MLLYIRKVSLEMYSSISKSLIFYDLICRCLCSDAVSFRRFSLPSFVHPIPVLLITTAVAISCIGAVSLWEQMSLPMNPIDPITEMPTVVPHLDTDDLGGDLKYQSISDRNCFSTRSRCLWDIWRPQSQTRKDVISWFFRISVVLEESCSHNNQSLWRTVTFDCNSKTTCF